MANQLKIRSKVEDGIAVVSARSRVLAVAVAAGSQVLATTAVAGHVDGHEEINPIFYPEFWMGVVAGAIVGVIGAKVFKRLQEEKKNR